MLIIFTACVNAQSASATWALIANQTASVSGDVSATDQSFSNMQVSYSSGVQRISPTGTAGAWPEESAENSMRYEQFEVSPATGYTFSISSISLYLYVNSGGGMRANVYYSKDPTFTTKTQIGSTYTLSNSAPGSPNVTASPSLTVNNGETFYLRVYPWYTTATTGKYVITKQVVISGATSLNAASFITTSVSSLSSFSQAVGTPSADQTYTVSGSSLVEDVVITPPAGFEISTNGGSSWNGNSSPVSLAQSGGGLAGQPVTISVRLNNASAVGSLSGNITHTSSGAETKNVAVSGVVIAAEPTTQSSISFGTVTSNSIVVNFPGGDGVKRIVVARQGSPVSFSPSDASAVSGVNSNFSSATDQGSGNKVVYDGAGTSVTVMGLEGSAAYHFAVYEYNVGTNNSQNYLTASPGTGSETTLVGPVLSVTKTSLSFGSITVNTVSEEQTYELSGTNLSPASGTISVTAPSGFEVSTTSGEGFGSSVNVPYTGGTLSATTIYARFSPTSVTSYNGGITNSGGGATTKNVAVSGNGTSASMTNELQGEDALFTSAYARSVYAGYSGTGYADFADKTGAAIEFVFSRVNAATDTIKIYYANGGSSRSMNILVNGSSIGTVSFTATGSWTTWSTKVIVPSLQEGMNRLRIESTTNNTNPNIDKIVISGETATPLYKLTLLKSGSGAVGASPSDSFYAAGTEITLTATPSSGNNFIRWTGTAPSTTNPYNLVVNSNKTIVGVFAPDVDFGSFSFESSPRGFASVSAYGTNGTTGGEGGSESHVEYVSTADELNNLMLRRVDANKTINFPPLTVYVVGTLTTSSTVSSMVDVKDAYDISIIGVGTDATIDGFGLKIVRSSNIIVRNIKFMNANDDGINIQADDDPSTGHHIWIDHCTFTNAYDGALDVTHTAAYVTLSWNYFYNHDKTCLLGHSDSQTSDTALKVTYHHNFFDQTIQRHPRVRYGKAHVFNNYYKGKTGTLYGVSSNVEADVLVEGNYFENVPIPTETSRDGSSQGDLVERFNVFVNCGAPGTRGTAFEASDFYSYTLDDANNIPELLTAYAGSGKFEFLSETPLPVELAGFTAYAKGNVVELNWRTAIEVNNYGFEIERMKFFANGNSEWQKIGFVEGKGVASTLRNYTYVDTKVSSGSYRYRLKQIDRDGKFTYSGTVEVLLGEILKSVLLVNSYPNPFNPETTIEFTVHQLGLTSVKIFNVLGQQVGDVFHEIAETGKVYKKQFNAATLPSGIYFCVVENSGASVAQKLLLMK